MNPHQGDGFSGFLWELYLQLQTPTLVPFPFMMYRLLCANSR